MHSCLLMTLVHTQNVARYTHCLERLTFYHFMCYFLSSNLCTNDILQIWVHIFITIHVPLHKLTCSFSGEGGDATAETAAAAMQEEEEQQQQCRRRGRMCGSSNVGGEAVVEVGAGIGTGTESVAVGEARAFGCNQVLYSLLICIRDLLNATFSTPQAYNILLRNANILHICDRPLPLHCDELMM